ncbi:cellulose binding domain-containing protein [Amycolatopsis sp. A133]|uniref:cellulose binding domain-containing protein n=1 Tax=Amycolatopsis sp. A133 TaxID=3064472 RepID=UPI0027E63449|nr:cellulose binding domain-containing protein [Amycolatopsis sp. A133]MDQ7803583.1 cellulose binding domain-containing protein [Amycolatopsis sp. A133]
MTARRLRWAAWPVIAVLAAAVPAAGTAGAADTPAATVTVNARAGLATMPDTGIGANHAVWDSQLGTDAVADLLGGAGVRTMRYPGGSYGDIYHWKDNTAPGGYVAPGTDFDTFMGGVRRAGAQPVIIANYGTGTPEEAADWVRYANVTKGYGVKYWEIGNELYGNGHYGANWEADNHEDKSPTGYANGVVAYADAMKAVDPSVKIGAVLTTPANWPDGVVGAGDTATWNQTVLSIAGPHIDFVILHWYPSGSTAAEALTRTEQVTDMLYLAREQITRYAGANPGRIGIAMTELNTPVGMNTQPGALFAADAYSSLLANGVFTVDWWNVHNGATKLSTVAGQPDYGDFGLLSSATCLDGGCEPALNTPFAPYYGLKMMSTFARPGDQFVRAAADDPLVGAHAVRRPNGDLAVLLLNKDPDQARAVTLDYAGYTPAPGAPQVFTFTNGATSISSAASGSSTSQTLPPYSLTTVVLHPATTASAGPGAPGQPSGTATDRTAAISWPAAAPGAHPIAKYEVYRQVGAVSEQWGETTGTSLDVGNLVPGSRYTVNVLARDTAGNVSAASPPLTLTTGAPATSSCTARMTDVTDWASGFVGGIHVTATGVTGDWTLTFTWPTARQRLTGGWNGTWAQNGTTVTVTSSAPAASGVDVGFTADYGGPNILPTAFTLNGVLCAAA